MSEHGILTTEMPAILGSDFCGLVVEVGPGCTKLQIGDYAFGLCRLGQNHFSPFQETFLVDEDLVFKAADRPEPVLAAGIGVGVLVCIAVHRPTSSVAFGGTVLTRPDRLLHLESS